MSPQAQRIAILQLMGWRIYESNGGMFYEKPGGNVRDHICFELTPDYPNDLNATHEAEKALITGRDPGKEDTELVQRYWMALYGVCGHTRWPFDAKSEERLEALCRTLGVWKESV